MRTDVNAFLGSYPFRRVPGTSVVALLAAMDRTGIDEAWVSHLPGIFWRDPAAVSAHFAEFGIKGRSSAGNLVTKHGIEKIIRAPKDYDPTAGA